MFLLFVLSKKEGTKQFLNNQTLGVDPEGC